MSTNCFIGKELPNGEIAGIGCVFDGYPEAIAPTLSHHYKTIGAVNRLLALGDIEGLDTSPTCCVPYIHENWKKPEEAHWFKDVNAAIYRWIGFEYAYIFTIAGNWVVISTMTDTKNRYDNPPPRFTLKDAVPIDSILKEK
jgi:hypothetical protein